MFHKFLQGYDFLFLPFAAFSPAAILTTQTFCRTTNVLQGLVIRRWAAVIVKTMKQTWWCFKYISDKPSLAICTLCIYWRGVFFLHISIYVRLTVRLTLVSSEYHIIAGASHFHKTPAIALLLWGFWLRRTRTYFSKYNLCHFLWLFLYQAIFSKVF